MQPLALIGCHLVYAADMVTDPEKTLPPGNGIGANDGVDGAETIANVVRRSSWLGVEIKALIGGGLRVSGLGEGRREAFQELPVGGRNLVVDLA